MVIVTANGMPSYDTDELLDNKALLERMLNVLSEDATGAEVRGLVEK